MATEEFGLAPSILQSLNRDAYYLRQHGRIQGWQEKAKTTAQALKREGLLPADHDRLQQDAAICEQEIEGIQRELKVAQQRGSPAQARREHKHGFPTA